MASATVTSKGQITIPKEVRDRLELRAGDRIVFVMDGNDVRLRPAKSDVTDLYGLLQVKGQRPRAIDEMEEGRTRALVAKHRGER